MGIREQLQWAWKWVYLRMPVSRRHSIMAMIALGEAALQDRKTLQAAYDAKAKALEASYVEKTKIAVKLIRRLAKIGCRQDVVRDRVDVHSRITADVVCQLYSKDELELLASLLGKILLQEAGQLINTPLRVPKPFPGR